MGVIGEERRDRLRVIREADMCERGVGGERWQAHRFTGPGFGDPIPVALGEVRALVAEQPTDRPTMAATGTAVSAQTWELIVTRPGVELQPDDVLTSLTTPTLAFRLDRRTDRRLHDMWSVAPATPVTEGAQV
jgi:hypothetical protein